MVSMLALAAMVTPALSIENWTVDLPDTLAQATKEKKLVLVCFNVGSCGGSENIIGNKVFDTKEFLAYAEDKFLLVDIEISCNKKLSPQLLKTNKTLKNQYAVTEFPSIFLMNPQGIVVAGFIGERDSIPVVQAMLDTAIIKASKIQAVIDLAASITKEEKIKTLYAAYQMLPANLQPSNTKMLAEIKALDTEDILGFKKLAAVKAAHDAEATRIMTSIKTLAEDPQAVLLVLDKELESPKLTKKFRKRLCRIKLNVLLLISENLHDIALAKLYAIELAESQDNPKMMLFYMNEMFADPAALLKEMKIIRIKLIGNNILKNI